MVKSSLIIHKAESITSTTITTGIPIQGEPYKVIPTSPPCKGKQRFSCLNCHSDVPARHYYQQCQQLCHFVTYSSTYSTPHWKNNCEVYAAHLKFRRDFSAQYRKQLMISILLNRSPFKIVVTVKISTSILGPYDYVPYLMI